MRRSLPFGWSQTLTGSFCVVLSLVPYTTEPEQAVRGSPVRRVGGPSPGTILGASIRAADGKWDR